MHWRDFAHFISTEVRGIVIIFHAICHDYELSSSTSGNVLKKKIVSHSHSDDVPGFYSTHILKELPCYKGFFFTIFSTEDEREVATEKNFYVHMRDYWEKCSLVAK